MNAPENERYNPSRPAKYDLANIPMRSQASYWATIEKIGAARTKKEKSEITKATGVSRLPLCAASVAFMHPTFFPLDPFHLFYENIMAFIWDIWTVLSKPGDIVHLSSDKAQKLGKAIPLAMSTLPPAFCGPIRDPYLKRQSQYKVYEWMALLHWYIIPIGMEIGMDSTILRNFSRFVAAIEFAMKIQPRDDAELQSLHEIITSFLVEYERLYIGNNPNNILRARLCIFQLIHVPHHIQWNGSIRVGSQATVERTIGEMGHKIRSRKSPFANLANLIYERELVKILALYYPNVDPTVSAQGVSVDNSELLRKEVSSKFMQEHPVRKKGGVHQDVLDELQAVADFAKCDSFGDGVVVRRWGKFKLLNGYILGSRLSMQKAQSARRSEWFEAINAEPGTLPHASDFNVIFGEALAFYEVKSPAFSHALVVYWPLEKLERSLNVPRGVWNRQTPKVANVVDILNIVGIWTASETSQRTYILRKHPGLAMLSTEECGIAMPDGDMAADGEGNWDE
ncbi:hypothetical protein M413DRAFT_79735 [Hebeloma cylindrosporum]|uniref:Uncharacterized protein n=1 Tax=Hebeloma cylindrosporum TaxID=76867 RepID=A0A0C3BUT6_HEBCY|nr:hypothetical protein M413DRAFT_79735 [Hebeloma cylindrosporum h7]